MSLQTQHNTTVASLQRELDQLRQEHQKVKIHLRELELGNDDLERNERAISSSLQDTEAKYSRVLEEKILLEHELLDKANVEAESQRLRDELRGEAITWASDSLSLSLIPLALDANEEIAILKEKLSQRNSRFSVDSAEESSKPISTPSTSTHTSDEDLLRTAPPPGIKLSDLGATTTSTARPRPISLNSSHSTFLQRTPRSHLSTPPSALSGALTRSNTAPGLSPTPRKLKLPTPRPISTRNVSVASTTSTTSAATTASRSKGVQMVSEMRAKVKNLEQRIHTRVPRLRMGSMSKATAPPMVQSDAMTNISGSSAGYSEDLESTVVGRRSAGSPERKKPAGDSGWVLIMEDSPMKDTAKEARSSRESRRDSNPFSASYRVPPSSYNNTSPTSATSTRSSSVLSQSVMPSGLRRPRSRISSDGRTSTSTVSSIPTSASRPTTPTFLPIASANLYNSTNGGKRTVGPSTTSQISGPNPKRGSVGSTPSNTPSPSMLPSSQLLKFKSKSKLPSLNPLGQSRMGKPTGRRSTGPESLNVEALGALDLGRSRSGSASAAYLKNKNSI